MALSLGVRVGSQITVGDDHLVRVKGLVPPNLIVISVNEGPDVVISDQSSTTILPGVKVFSGIGATGGVNRLVFEADRSNKIYRK